MHREKAKLTAGSCICAEKREKNTDRYQVSLFPVCFCRHLSHNTDFGGFGVFLSADLSLGFLVFSLNFIRWSHRACTYSGRGGGF